MTKKEAIQGLKVMIDTLTDLYNKVSEQADLDENS